MNHRTRLELTWIGKENRPRLEPRVLLEDPGKSYHAKHQITDHDIFDNRLGFRARAKDREDRSRADEKEARSLALAARQER